MEKIDIVVPWVDDNDPVWRACKKEYSNQANYGGDIVERFREWGLLKYWFRGVEKYAPWVNRIHFITCGHLPAWLNTNQRRKLKYRVNEVYVKILIMKGFRLPVWNVMYVFRPILVGLLPERIYTFLHKKRLKYGRIGK